jgi:uncharacterized protein YyaL (SSP411 family)
VEPAQIPGVDALDNATREFAAAFDARRGGFGSAPKFPRPSELLFLLREHARTGAPEPRDMTLVTLRAMALGGMRDHVGGGFHRYSVDAEWRVPHFEKMLYDQAQLVLAYLEAAQITGDRFYSDVALDTLDYVRRDLTDPDGGFYSAEDADSIPPEHAHQPHPHKMEGAFYVWRDAEIGASLGEDADIFRLRYGVLPDGNAPADPQAEFTGKNLLHTARPIEEIVSMTGSAADDVVAALARARTTLLSLREQRPRPHLDDKVMTAWNGLMIAAFARAARVLPDAICLDAARRAATFVRNHLWNPSSGTLLRRYRQGHAGVDAYAEDYAFLIAGLLELFQADGDPQWLEWSLALQRTLDDLFWDPADGGWFSTTGKDSTVLLRMKEDYDGAEPAASSVAVLNLLMLSHLVGEFGAGYREKIDHTLGVFAARGARLGRAAPMMLAALSTYHQGLPQLVIVEEGQRGDSLWSEVRRRYRPTLLAVPVTPGHREALAQLLPWIATMRSMDGQPTAYVCRDFTCETPVTAGDALGKLL